MRTCLGQCSILKKIAFCKLIGMWLQVLKGWESFFKNNNTNYNFIQVWCLYCLHLEMSEWKGFLYFGPGLLNQQPMSCMKKLINFIQKSVTSSSYSSPLIVSSVCHDHDHGLLFPFRVICYVDALMQVKVIYCAPFFSI